MTLKPHPFLIKISGKTLVVAVAMTLVTSAAQAKSKRSPYGDKPTNNSFVRGSSLKKYENKKIKQRKTVETNMTRSVVSTSDKAASDKTAGDKALTEKASCIDTMGAAECQIFALTNKTRESRKLKPLRFFKNCYQSAQAHSIYMATMSNTGQGLSRSVNHDQFKERIKKFDVGGTRVTENVAGGKFKKMDELFNNWMNSPEHRGNILDPKVTAMALSMVEDKDGQQFWTQCFSNFK